jgi:hypothetical protein
LCLFTLPATANRVRAHLNIRDPRLDDVRFESRHDGAIGIAQERRGKDDGAGTAKPSFGVCTPFGIDVGIVRIPREKGEVVDDEDPLDSFAGKRAQIAKGAFDDERPRADRLDGLDGPGP